MGLSIGIYWKRFSAMMIVVGIGFVIWSFMKTNVSADDVPFDYSQKGTAKVVIDLDKRGRTNVNGVRTVSIISDRPTSQRLWYIATDAAEKYIDLLTVVINLPTPLQEDSVKLKEIGAYGIGSSSMKLVSQTQIVYEVVNISPQAIYTIQIDFPLDYFDLPFWQKIGPAITELPISVWLAIAFAIPLGAMLTLALINQKALSELGSKLKSTGIRDTLPEELAPALAGVLVSGKMTPRMLAATLLDLAEREYLVISNHSNIFSFGKRRSNSGRYAFASVLTSFEQKLLEKIFTPKEVRSTQTDIEVRLGSQLFSRKIAEIYLEVYDTLTESGYFTDNPNRVWRRFRTIGIIILFTALIGFALTLAFLSSSKYPLVSWVGLMIASLIIMHGTQYLPNRSAKGVKALKEWIAFRNWLSSPTAITSTDAPQIFRRNLPYAVALGVEVEWTRRFAGTIIQPPDWLITQMDYMKIDDLAGQIFPIIGYIATNLAAVRDPNS